MKSKDGGMAEFLEIKSLGKAEQKKVLAEIEKVLAKKKKEGLVTDKEIREIAEMRLNPLPDIQDVQSVHEDLLFKKDREP